MKSVTLFALLVLFALSTSAEVKVKLGNEILARDNYKLLAGKRVGLITNPSGVNHKLEATADVFHSTKSVNLVAFYAPEHGVYGNVYAGDYVTNSIDARTGKTVYSIYAKHRKPSAEMLKGIDVMVFDLQDIGCRSYTFISTLGLAMEACAESNIEFVVLDRPNPLGGERIEGPMLEEKFRSFVSQWDIPYIYGLTAGELAQMINGEGWIKKKCKLTVVEMKGWKRSMTWRDTGLPWVPASPHIPHADSPLFYCATGIIGELGTANIGVGYPLPFQTLGIPGADMHKLAEALNAYELPGVKFKPITYKPFYSFLKDTNVAGVQLYFLEPNRAQLVAINFYLLEAVKKVTGTDLFAEAVKAKKKFDMFDKVNGTDKMRQALQDGKPAAEIVASWKPGEDAFRKARKKYLVY